MNTQAPLERYRAALLALPAPGTGNGCHTALLGVANLGVLAGLDDGQIVADIATAVPAGRRPVAVSEISATVRTARRSATALTPVSAWRAAYHPSRPQPVTDWDAVRNAIIKAGGGEVDPYGPDFWESSPTRIDWPPEHAAAEFLTYVFTPGEHVFIGHRQAVGELHCRTVEAWRQEFRERPPTEQFGLICPNPVSGTPGPTREGRPSYRALSCITVWRFGVIEFDREDMPKPRQLAFWRGLGLPNVAAIVDSGGKSLHTWLRFDAADAEHWARAVKPVFQRLAALGVDAAGASGGQLCRLPGAPRPERGTLQRLLWLCPAGGRLP